MPRDTDDKKTRKALRKLRKAADRAKTEGIELTDWEQEFVEGVDERLTKYGSAFNDPNLGGTDDALSRAQSEILRQLDKKSRGKGGSSFKQRKPLKSKKGAKGFTPNIRDLNEDVEQEPSSPPIKSEKPALSVIRASELEPPRKEKPGNSPEKRIGTDRSSDRRAAFRIIDGGKSDQTD